MLSSHYGWTPSEIADMTWPQIKMYLPDTVAENNGGFDGDGKMLARKGKIRFTGPEAELKYRQWRIANGFGDLDYAVCTW